jgi:hypothetical protein
MIFEREKSKRKGADITKKSARILVAEIINEKYGTSISSRTIYSDYQNGIAGESNRRKGQTS